jgi:cell division septal protein FtsQ
VHRGSTSLRLLSAALIALAGWLIYWFGSADLFYIRDLQVKGNERVSHAELMQASALAGINIFWVNPQDAEEALEALPDVASARVHCSLPADCLVELVERPVVFVWRQGDARVWIAADGTVVLARGDLPNAVVFDAVGSTALKPGDSLDLTLVSAVQQLERLQPDVRLYQYSDQYGLTFQHARGWQVRLGNGEAIETKVNLSHTLEAFLEGQGIGPAFVDVRYPEAPYYGEQ